MDPTSDLNRISLPKTIKIKKNTLKQSEITDIPKPKRKYTRKNIDITLQPEPPVVSISNDTNLPVIKIKRKYTRKNQPKINDININKEIDTNILEMPKSEVVPINTQPEYFVPEKKTRFNELLAELMDDLSYIMRKRKDMMRAKAYNNAKETIQLYDGDIIEPNQLKGKPGIGTTIYQKIVDYISTGTLKILEEEKDMIIRKKAMEVFTNIYGIGEKKAEELVDKGIISLEQLAQKQMELLNDKQRIGLKYYHDIMERIPRNEIIQYEEVFKKSITSEISDLKLQIVGSYRRGLSSSGDIDVILTSENPQHFSSYIDNLLKNNIIVEVLSRGPAKCLVITKLPDGQFSRRVDFLYTSPREFPFSILYFTGSKGFNTTMREHALRMKYTLNEHGLSHMIGRTKGALVEHIFPDEKSIFDFLNLQYKNPEERTDGKAVVEKIPSQNIQIEIAEISVPVPMAEVPVQVPVQVPVPTTDVNISIMAPEKKRRITKKNIIKKETTQKITNEIKEEPSILIAPPPMRILEPAEPAPSMGIISEKKEVCTLINKSTLQNITKFKMNGIKVIESMSESELSQMLDAANNAFHCTDKPVMTDAEYDILHEYIEKRFPQNQILENVGGPVQKNKAVLPYEMWSMDKIKPDTNALVEWKKKYTGDYVISCKLDGVSGLYSTEGPEPKLYTRGNGKVGEDISYLIPFLKLPKEKNIVIRGEFVIKRKVFETKYAAKYANARNLVAGITNRKTLNKNISDVDFVAYEVIKPDALPPSKQMSVLSTMNVDVVQNKTFSDVTNEFLSQILQDWRKNYIYDIDGIIVSNDRVYPRISDNPEHSFAFKMVLSDQIAETHVLGVEWNASKDGYLKPRVHLEPVRLGGVNIEYATGFNAEFISKNRIGVGAIVKIIRSGDVIPYIKEVTAPAEHAMMPTVPFRWNDTHVDVILENIEDDEMVREKIITMFFKTLSVDGIGPGNVKKMINSGFDTIPKILHMKESDFLNVGGFQLKTAKKLLDNIHASIDRASLVELMAASNKFGRGFGIKKIEAIMESYPTVLEQDERDVVRLASVVGMSKSSAQDFINRIPQFFDFMRECGLEDKLNEKTSKINEEQPIIDTSTNEQKDTEVKVTKPGILGSIYNMIANSIAADTTHPLYGKTVVNSGFTDKNKELENKLKYVGAKLGKSVSKKTAALVVKSEEDHTGKWLAARENNVPIYTIDNFMKKFFQKEGIQEVEHPV